MVGQGDESAWSLKGALHSSSNSFSDPFGISFPPYHMQLVFCLQLPLACSPGAGVFITVNVQVDGGGIREGIMQVRFYVQLGICLASTSWVQEKEERTGKVPALP